MDPLVRPSFTPFVARARIDRTSAMIFASSLVTAGRWDFSINLEAFKKAFDSREKLDY